ncbi:MAG: hypothetical protein KAV45_00380 [Calditrichia bacterium]|jgi:hypothetical protein|nr:hypothetical protein [Calditrichia bacterium]
MDRRAFNQVMLANILGLYGLSGLKEPLQSFDKKEHIRGIYYAETEGNYFEIGNQYAKIINGVYKEHIKNISNRLQKNFHSEDLKQATSYLKKQLEIDFPYLLEEMRGMAIGAGLEFEAVLMANLAPAYGAFVERKDGQKPSFGCPTGLGFDDFPGDDGCTNIIFPKSDVGPIMGRTLDGSGPGVADGVVRLIKPDNGYNLLCFCRLGGISTIHGINEHGLGVGEASLHFPSVNPLGVIRNFLPRLILQKCATVQQAIHFCAKHPVMRHGIHIALVDKNGDAAIIECSPHEMYVRRSSGEPVFCTNHTATPALRKHELSRGEIGDKNSDERFAYLERVTSATGFITTLNTMKELICSHRVPGGICQHGELKMYTQRTFMVNCVDRKLYVSSGPACENELREYSLIQ